MKRKSFISKFKNRRLARLVLTLFCVSLIDTQLIYSAESISGIEGAKEALASFETPLPAKLGRMVYQSKGVHHAKLLAVHIQDAHAQPKAQRKILKLLEWLAQHREKDGMKSLLVVALEGASDDLHPEYLNFFKDYPEVNQAIVDDLTAKGELEAGELFAWQHFLQPDPDITIVGAEDPELFRKNFEDYQTLLFQRPEIKVFLESWNQQFELAASHLLSSELQKFLKTKKRLGQSPEGNPAYYRYLQKELKNNLEIDLDAPLEQLRFPNWVRLRVLQKLQLSLDLSAAKKEKKILLNRLKQKVSSGDEAEFIQVLGSSTVTIDLREQLEVLMALLEKYLFAPEDYRHYLDRMGALAIKQEINAVLFEREIKIAEDLIVAKLAKRETEKSFLALLKRLKQLETMLLIRMTPDDFFSLQYDSHPISPARIARDFKVLFSEGTLQGGELRTAYLQAVNFYRVALKRDAAMSNHLYSHMQMLAVSTNRPVIGVLVSGGFHAPGVRARMKAWGVPALGIQPAIDSLDSGELYERVMRDDHAAWTSRGPKPDLSSQESLLLKSLLSVGLEQLKDYAGDQTLSRLSQALNDHPLFGKQFSARLNQSSKVNEADILLIPRTDSVTRDLAAPGLNAAAIRKGVLIASPGVLPQEPHTVALNFRLSSDTLDFYGLRVDGSSSGVDIAGRSEVRVKVNPSGDLKVAILGAQQTDLTAAGTLATLGHSLTISAAVSENLLARIAPNSTEDALELQPLKDSLVSGKLQTRDHRHSSEMDALLRENDVLVLSSQLGEGLDYGVFLKDMGVLAQSLGEGVHRLRQASDNSRKVIILRDHLGIGAANIFYDTLKRTSQHDNNFDLIYIPQTGQRDPEGKIVENILVAGVQDKVLVAEETLQILERLYPETPIQWVNVRDAELAYESYLVLSAAKLAHFRDLAPLAEKIGGDVYETAFGAGLDGRIGFEHINPSLGFGGRLVLLLDWILQSRLVELSLATEGRLTPGAIRSILHQAVKKVRELHPKGETLEAVLSHLSTKYDLPMTTLYLPLLLEMIGEMNRRSIQVSADTILKQLSPSYHEDELRKKTVAIWGVGFRGKDSQITHSPVLILIDQLVQAGVRRFNVSDPSVAPAFKAWIARKRNESGNNIYQGVEFSGMEGSESPLDLYESATGADITVVAQESHLGLATLDIDKLKQALNGRPFFDGIGLFGRRANGDAPRYTFEELRQRGIQMMSLGRPVLDKSVDSQVFNKPEDLARAGIVYNPKKITVMGGGYVGLVTAAKLAELGHDVWVYDIVPEKIAMLSPTDPSKIETPIFEPGLQELIRNMARAGRFHATSDLEAALRQTEDVYVAVPTPQGDDGAADLKYIHAAARQFAQLWKVIRSESPQSHPAAFVIKSTVPSKAISDAQEIFRNEGLSEDQAVAVSNPEFLREGSALADVGKPDRTVFGIPAGLQEENRSAVTRELMEIWAGLMNQYPHTILVTTPEVSTMVKYAANALLAISITVSTLLAQEAINHQADFTEVIAVLRNLAPIGKRAFIEPGCWGGSCFPKDTRAIGTLARLLNGGRGSSLPLVAFADGLNDRFKSLPIEVIQNTLDRDLNGAKLAFWGMTFKPRTDDVREAPAAAAVLKALQAGVAEIRISDSIAAEKAIGPIWDNFIREIYKVAQSDGVFQESFFRFLSSDSIPSYYHAALFRALQLENNQTLLQVFLNKNSDLNIDSSIFSNPYPGDAELLNKFDSDSTFQTLRRALSREIHNQDQSRTHAMTELLRWVYFSSIFLMEHPENRPARSKVLFTSDLSGTLSGVGTTDRPADGLLLFTDWPEYTKISDQAFQALLAKFPSLTYIVDTRGIWGRQARQGLFSSLGISYVSNRIAPIFAATSRSEIRLSSAQILGNLELPADLTTRDFDQKARRFAAQFSTVPLSAGSRLAASKMAGIYRVPHELSAQFDFDWALTYAVLITEILPTKGSVHVSAFVHQVRVLAKQLLGPYAELFIGEGQEPVHLVYASQDSEIPAAFRALLALGTDHEQLFFLTAQTAADALRLEDQFETKVGQTFGDLESVRRRFEMRSIGEAGGEFTSALARVSALNRGERLGIPLTDQSFLDQARYLGKDRYRFDAMRLDRDAALMLAYAVLKKQLPDSPLTHDLEEAARREGIDLPDFLGRLQQFMAQFRALASAA